MTRGGTDADSEVGIGELASELTRVKTGGKNVGTTGLGVEMTLLGLESNWVTRTGVGSEVDIGELVSELTRVKTRGKNVGMTGLEV